MGLTIHYELSTTLTAVTDVRQLVEAIRQHALDLPFKEVGELQEFLGADCEPEISADASERWLKTQATGKVITDKSFNMVTPEHAIAFSTWPGEGCEAANFGLCCYPEFFPSKNDASVATGLIAWCWSSFCKTQYASDPRCGGVENFLRCHLTVLKLLEFIEQTGIVSVKVLDEGGFWEKRNVDALAKEVNAWNQMMAGFVSSFREANGGSAGSIEAPITGFPNFEHLEAKGLEQLNEIKKRFPKPE